MTTWEWLLLALAVLLLVYVVLVLALVLAGRRSDARAVAGLHPGLHRVLQAVAGRLTCRWWRKALLAGLIGYLAMPLDLVPDFIPVAGHLDDAIVVVLVLRTLLRGSGGPLLREHWPGSERSLRMIQRFA